MNVLILVKVRINPQQRRPAANVGNGRTGGFLHHVAEVAGQFHFSASFDHGCFDVQYFPADRGVRKPAHQADRRLVAAFIRFELDRTKEFFKFTGLNRQRAEAVFRNPAGSLAANCSQFAFQLAHTRFTRITANQTAYRIIADLQLVRFQPMLFPLFGQQVTPGDLELFLIGVAGKLNYFHPVQKSSRDRIRCIGCRNKEHFGEVNRYFQKMITERAVLLRIKCLKQR